MAAPLRNFTPNTSYSSCLDEDEEQETSFLKRNTSENSFFSLPRSASFKSFGNFEEPLPDRLAKQCTADEPVFQTPVKPAGKGILYSTIAFEKYKSYFLMLVTLTCLVDLVFAIMDGVGMDLDIGNINAILPEFDPKTLAAMFSVLIAAKILLSLGALWTAHSALGDGSRNRLFLFVWLCVIRLAIDAGSSYLQKFNVIIFMVRVIQILYASFLSHLLLRGGGPKGKC